MNKINTTAIAVGAAMPYQKTMIDFLNDGNNINNQAILQCLLGTNSTSGYYCLSGCEISGSGTFTIQTGYVILASGEIVLAVGNVITPSVGQVIVGTVGSFYITGYDPVTFSNGTTNNVHEQKVINWSAGTSGSASFDYGNLQFLNEEWSLPSYLTGWSNDNYNGNGGLKYKKNVLTNSLIFKGSTQSSNVGGNTYPVFTLPTTHRPSNNKCLPILINEDSSSNLVTALLIISASTGNVIITSSTASTSIDIATFDGIVIPLD
jgi:hypothetical protein